MRKEGLVLAGILLLGVLALSFVSARNDSSGVSIDLKNSAEKENKSDEELKERTEKKLDAEKKRLEAMKEKIEKEINRVEKLREKIRERNGTFRVEDKEMRVSELSDTRKEFIVNKINARTGLNLSIEDIENGSVGSIMSAYMSNGAKAEIRIMPDKASEIAREKMRVRCEERNCTFELKEVRRGNESRAVYEVKTEKESKILFFKKKMEIRTEIDAETGDADEVHKPWWAFIAKEDEDINATVQSG